MDILSRHFMYAQLEAILCRCRDVFASALDEYDQACRQHDAELDGIRRACLAKWGKVPLLETYRQMAIRQQNAHNYSEALWWAGRGIALYGNDCASLPNRRRCRASWPCGQRTRIIQFGPRASVAAAVSCRWQPISWMT
ncbi:MAG: hypothetical protein J2P32_02425 [Actinobacteria bacterium]|nr:hypothetical protein [Actinomycetota bacterium]